MERTVAGKPDGQLPSEIIEIIGLPDDISPGLAAVCRSRIDRALRELLQGSGASQVSILAGTADALRAQTAPGRATEAKGHADGYRAVVPRWCFEQLVVPKQLREELLLALALLEHEKQLFDNWGLRAVEPFPRSVLNFHGAPGTGKTLAAHAAAFHLGSKILSISYAEVESMYHGEGPKNIAAIFAAAEEQQAVLFIDEADSLLSSRLARVTQAAEQAMNSMRSQLLICLEQYHGVVIFATNLVGQYDRAFETRVRHLFFPLPDLETRAAIWRAHLPAALPLAAEVDVALLAADGGACCGRDIKNVVIDAALRAACAGHPALTMADFQDALAMLVTARLQTRDTEEQQTTPLPNSLAEFVLPAQSAETTTSTETQANSEDEEEDFEFDAV